MNDVTVALTQRGQLLRAVLDFAGLGSYDEKGRRATFYTSGMERSPTSATGTAC